MQMRARVRPWALGALLLALLAGSREARAQSDPGSEAIEDEASPENSGMKEPQNTVRPASRPVSTGKRRPGLFADFLRDQQDLWTSPARLRFSDTAWLVPAAGIAAGLFLTDAQYSRHLPADA